MQARTEPPQALRPRFVVGQVTGYTIKDNLSNGSNLRKRRTYYVMDMLDRARVVGTFEGGHTYHRWRKAKGEAEKFAANLNRRNEEDAPYAYL